MGKKITLGGLPVEIVADEVAETAAYVVCVPASLPPIFADDLFGTCASCGIAVRFRPYMPKTPPRICVECVLGIARRQ